jgi:hypothetical protein
MRTMYELRLGDLPVGVIEANTAQEAVLDYLRSLGHHDDEIVRVSFDTASWRGAVYTAVPVSNDLVEESDS